ncbi:LysR family transcriptional regulator [Bradyrhizobium sp. Leo121]|uniref:LysR family transcriptional regulator n=1 Tax=Bradyrhizobium sp. Leo121 TaxID=1571195 RepID=UPI00102A4763|nr:LysR family transcriptional regulator [Bradyrhizobium sp. Leo121]RZN16687.1 LysR family transcriptional regulator [Bradyrhizobium sp. Leo121]
MDLANVALFRTIAAAGSLSAAARQVGGTPMLVSRRLAALEAELGVRLFHRTTRSLALTPDGEAFLPHANALLEARETALASIGSGERGVSGMLKMTAPSLIGRSIVVPVVTSLLADNPLLRADVTLTDGVMDLAATGLDLAVRVSPLVSSDMIAAHLAYNPRVVCAAPSYIARHGKPSSIDDLACHTCLKLHAMETWPFQIAGELHRVRIDGSFSANSVDAVRSACIEGLGIAMLSYWDVWKGLSNGDLQQIDLDRTLPDELGVWAVYPSRKHTPPRVHECIRALKSRFIELSARTRSVGARIGDTFNELRNLG